MIDPFEGVEPDAELAARAVREREAIGYPSSKVRPFVHELAARGNVTASEWVVLMNSYERRELVSKLELGVLVLHTEYCLSQCSGYRGPIPTTYDETVIHELAPELLKRIRATSTELLRTCANCSRAAVCLGRYEVSDGPFDFACGVCCAHGCEDGVCYALEDLTPERITQLTTLSADSYDR